MASENILLCADCALLEEEEARHMKRPRYGDDIQRQGGEGLGRREGRIVTEEP